MPRESGEVARGEADATAAGTGPMHMIYEALGVPMVVFGIGNANSRDHGGNENVSLADYYTHIELIKELIANYE